MISTALGIAEIIKLALDFGPGVLKGYAEIKPYVDQIFKLTTTGEGITQAELDGILNSLRRGSAELQGIDTNA